MECINKLSTEKLNPNSLNIESKNTLDILKCINEEDKKVAYCIEKELISISNLIDAILKKLNEKSRIIYIGAGTSGRLGILDASECPPTYGVSSEFIQGIIAGGNSAMFQSKENVEDSEIESINDLKNIHLSSNDIVIGIAASGRTPYVLSAINYANSIGALTGSICCAKNSKLSSISQYPIEVVVGPEIVAGSTRMKSGSAQKMILNMISTIVMIKLGKVYSGYMIDLKANNEKLVERSKNILMNIANIDYTTASKYLEKSGYNIKKAIKMINGE